jgi:hypothetical protein
MDRCESPAAPHTVSLLVCRAGGLTWPVGRRRSTRAEHGFNVVLWRAGEVDYALLSDLDAQESWPTDWPVESCPACSTETVWGPSTADIAGGRRRLLDDNLTSLLTAFPTALPAVRRGSASTRDILPRAGHP